ncbi:hypothetical protein Tco_1554468 [Tanacetum coccineum]
MVNTERLPAQQHSRTWLLLKNLLLQLVHLPQRYAVQDTPSTSISQTIKEAQSHVIPTSVEEDDHELHEFEHLEIWKLVPRPDQVMIFTLKWIYKVKLDELGGVMKNKANQGAKGKWSG